MLGRVNDTVLLVIFQSKIDKRAIASSSSMGNRTDSRMSQSGTDRMVPFRWEEVAVPPPKEKIKFAEKMRVTSRIMHVWLPSIILGLTHYTHTMV